MSSCADSPPKPDYIGHRARIRARLLEGDLLGMADYELLEYLLCLAVPRGDTKPLAKRLIKQFGSLPKVLSTPSDELKTCQGVGEAVLALCKAVREAGARLAKEDMCARPVIQSWHALLDYCRATMGHATIEQFRVLFLNSKNMLIGDRVVQTGTVNETPVYPREIIKQALLLDASAIILVHNHPSGDTKPSTADIEITQLIERGVEIFNIELHDHVIISNKSHFSFKSHGLL